MQQRRGGAPESEGSDHHGGDQHGRSELVDPGRHLAFGAVVGGRIGDPVAEDDVEHETGAVGEGEDETQRLARDPGIGQRGNAGDRQHQGSQISLGAGSGGGQHDDPEELDGPHCGERDPVDGEVEERVHGRENGAEREQEATLRPGECPDQPPGPTPAGEDRRRRRDPQPGHPEHVDMREQQHRQRGHGRARPSSGHECPCRDRTRAATGTERCGDRVSARCRSCRPRPALRRLRPGAPHRRAAVQDHRAGRSDAQVSECHRITGEDCLLLKVHAATMTDLENSLDRFLVYGQTVTSIIVSTPIPPRPLPLSVTDRVPGRAG